VTLGEIHRERLVALLATDPGPRSATNLAADREDQDVGDDVLEVGVVDVVPDSRHGRLAAVRVNPDPGDLATEQVGGGDVRRLVPSDAGGAGGIVRRPPASRHRVRETGGGG
jgi:hypothetical protein